MPSLRASPYACRSWTVASAFYSIQLQGLGARVISVAAAGEEKRSPCAPPLMLFAGLQDVGHEDVAARRGGFSLRSFSRAISAFYCISNSILDNDTVSEIRVSSFLFG